MKTEEKDFVQADNKIAAFYKSKLLNAVNATGYSDREKAKANGMLYCLEMCYGFSRSFINFRKTFIAIKFEDAKVKNRKLLAELEAEYDAAGVKKIKTGQGIIYRIAKVS